MSYPHIRQFFITRLLRWVDGYLTKQFCQYFSIFDLFQTVWGFLLTLVSLGRYKKPVEDLPRLRPHSEASTRSPKSSAFKREQYEQRKKAVPRVRFCPFSTFTVIINSPNCQNTIPSKHSIPSKQRGGEMGKAGKAGKASW
ncbi:hypothetical protein ACMFMG_009892 [Clarireedia jacksonii]